MTPAAWPVVEAIGTAGDLHAALPVPEQRSLRVCRVTGPAFVLGSAQRLDDAAFARARAAGLEVVRRRSGGGAVLLAPEGQVWVDVCVPRDDLLWVDDVGRSGEWLGDAWVGAAEALGVRGAVVHRGPMVRTSLSDDVCFAGLGPGEVTVGPAKLVGVSQRRVREGAVLQCTVPLTWDPAPLVEVLALDAAAAATVAAAATPLDVPAADVLAALVAHLP